MANKKCIKNSDFEILVKKSKVFSTKLKTLNNNLRMVYLKDSKSSMLFSPAIINDIQVILDMYNLLISKLMLFYSKSRNLERVIDNNQPVIINRLQNLLIESFVIVIYSINSISKSDGSKTPGIDGISFKDSKYFEDKYILDNMPKKKRNAVKYMSISNIETQRYKIINADLKKQFTIQAQDFNNNLKLEFISRCQIKSFSKNYVADTVIRQ